MAGSIDNATRGETDPERESTLAHALSRLEFLLATSPTVVYSDKPLPGYPTNYISEGTRELIGHPPEVVCSPGWFEANVHPDDLEGMRRGLDAIVAGDQTTQEYRLLHADGTYRWIRDVTRLVRDADGKPIEIVGSLTDITATRDTDARFRAMADSAAHGVWLVDPGEGLVYANPVELASMGLSWDEARGHGWPNSLHHGDRERIRTELSEAMAAGATWTGAARRVRPDGSMIEFEGSAAPVTDGEGDIIAYVGQTIDVTDKRRAEAALRDSEVRFHQLMANLGVGIWLFDTASERMDYVSPGYERMFGISLADLQADPWCWLARVDPDDRERVRSIISETPNDVDVEYRFRRPDGSMGVALGRSFPVLGTDGASGRTAGIVADITASRETEDQLRELGTALDQTSDGVLMLDADGVVLYANAAYERITGFGPTEVLGHVRHALPEAMVDGDMRERIRRGEMWKGRVKSPRSDGSEYLAEVTVWPIADGDERAARHIAIVRDITVEAGLSEALAEESRAREALAASIVHLSGATRAEDTAEAICDELMALPGADIASVLVFDRDGTATPLAFRGPPGSPLRVGQPLPESRSHYLFERAALRTWVEDWRPSAEDGGYGARWTDLGLDSVAYLPIRIRGDLGGLMVVGSMQPGGALVLSSKLPGLQELAVVSGALLAEQLSERLRNGALRARIQRVIAEDGFSPVFQPVVDLASSTVVGFEALTRFADGTAPDRVFADAEAAGLGLELEEATIAAALAASEDLQPGAWLALNVSPALASSAERLRRAVGRSERPIVLEITEQSPVEDYDAVHEAVRSLGPDVRLAVDDAGAGFASLRHIIELRPQFVKLDMALVRGIDRDPARQALVAGMVYYAGATGCALIAEGVEAEGERRTLRRLGVSFGQGYLLGKPGPAVPAPPRRMRRSRDVAQERVPQAV